jgi:peptide/nickel transport system permease protein
VAQLIRDRLGPTLQLTGGALLLAVGVAVPLGVLAAVRRNSAWDTLASGTALFGISFPSFWLGIVLILLFSEVLGLLPPSGLAPFGREGDLGARLRHAALPTLTLGLIQMAGFMRFTRSSLLEALGRDFVRTARAKGVAELWVVTKHTLRNAALPILTITGLQFGTLLGGAVVTETVFSWPGLGRLVIEAINNRDFPVVQAAVVVIAVFVVAVNVAVDLLYAVLDPRIRLSGSA